VTTPEPRTLIAGERESGTLCALCGNEIALGQATSICRTCGAVHHSPCWDTNHGCGAYECSLSSRLQHSGVAPTITITRDELLAAEPLPSKSVTASSAANEERGGIEKRRWNRTAVAASMIALIGIPLFGLVGGTTAVVLGCIGSIAGLLAIVIGCISLVAHSHGRRGMALGVVAIVLGLLDIIGWAIGFSNAISPAHSAVALNELSIDLESLENLPERLARAMRANVVIESVAGLGGRAIGSGVIMSVRDGMAQIVTNRHTVDMSYTGAIRPAPKDLDSLGDIRVITVGQVPVKAKVEWIAPHGVDLAIISAPVLADEVQEAHWDRDATPHIGDSVFAVGNPHGLGWTHSAGDISQVRRQRHGDYNFRLLQTTAAINPGNSGGGLYDAEGRLIGINTMTSDKRFAEGLGFSIALPTLLDLVPEHLELPKRNPVPKP
jgi:S1-C subfamily serine protease